MDRVLVIDDDDGFRTAISEVLEGYGYRVVMATSAREGLRALFATRPDVVLLDLVMPDLDGWSTIGRIREISEEMPILVLSGLDAPSDRVRAFRAGADDFVIKPCVPSELAARVEAALRRSRLPSATSRAAGEPVVLDWLTVDPAACRVVAHGQELDLTPQEFRLLAALARRAGQVCTHDDLISALWGRYEGVDAGGALSVLVGRLRRRIGEHRHAGGSPIETVRGFGYRLRVSAHPS